MKPSNPLVSVYITTFNRLELLQRALHSVLAQTYQNIEVIIVDDGSTDGTREFLLNEQTKHSNVKVILNSVNIGACAGRNKAIESAKGEFITGLDDDDYFLPERVTNFVNHWQTKDKGVIALYSNAKIKKSDNTLVDRRRKLKVSAQELFFDNSIGNQVFTKPKYLLSVGAFDINMPAWQDLDCWIRLLSLGDAQNIGGYTYVTDIGHPHERITSQKLERISDAFLQLKSKAAMSYRQALRLESQLIPYDYSKYSIPKFLLKSILILDPMLTAKLLNFHFKKMKN